MTAAGTLLSHARAPLLPFVADLTDSKLYDKHPQQIDSLQQVHATVSE